MVIIMSRESDLCPLGPRTSERLRQLRWACQRRRYADRDWLILCLFLRAGLTPAEVAALTGDCLLDAHGRPTGWMEVRSPDAARRVPVHRALLEAIRAENVRLSGPVIFSERRRGDPLHKRAISNKVREIADDAAWPELTPSNCRRWFIHQIWAAASYRGVTFADRTVARLAGISLETARRYRPPHLHERKVDDHRLMLDWEDPQAFVPKAGEGLL